LAAGFPEAGFSEAGFPEEEWILHCVCSPTPSRWHWRELKMYAVPSRVHHRGYGAANEIVPVAKMLRRSRQKDF
jgi:hypothetical protein